MKTAYTIIVLFVLLPASPAATLVVPTEYPTIMSAVNAAVNGDTVLVLPGQYYESVNFQGKGIVVKATGGPNSTLIYTPSGYVATYFANGEGRDSVLEGFRITNHWQIDEGTPVGEERFEKGGGCYIVNSSPTIRYNRIQDCHLTGPGAHIGCGIYIDGGSPLIENNEIMYNVGDGSVSVFQGGGIYCENDSSEIIGNSIIGNSAQNGAGIYCHGSWALIVGNLIADNDAEYDGGGIDFGGFRGVASGNLISGNTGTLGAGLYCRNSDCVIVNNVITENYAITYGGVRIRESQTTFENNTIAFNTAIDSTFGTGGIGIVEDTLLIKNCVIWGNNGPVGSQISVIYDGTNPALVEIEYSDVEGGLDSIFVDEECSAIWGPGNIDEDPLFQVGPLSDYHLSYGSPCIDAGNPAPEYYDPEDPFNPGYAMWPAMGFLRNDMGAYGGGGVGYWLGVEEEPIPPVPGPTLNSYPNPFCSSANVVFQLLEPGRVALRVYDLSGHLVEELYSGDAPPGPTVCSFDGSDLPSGVYILHMVTEDDSLSFRSILVR